MTLDYVGQLRTNGELMAAAAERDLDGLESHVPSCPEWNVGKLITHTGIHHRWVAEAVSGGGEPPGNPDRPGLRGPELIEWFRTGWGALGSLLERSDDATPAWSWAGDNRVGFWRRRTALETLVHRWDAENATGDISPLDGDLATDGVDEMLFVMVPDGDSTYKGEPGTVVLATDDTEKAWRLALAVGQPVAAERVPVESEAQLTLRAPASDLLLFVWGRLGPEVVTPSAQGPLYDSVISWIQD